MVVNAAGAGGAGGGRGGGGRAAGRSAKQARLADCHGPWWCRRARPGRPSSSSHHSRAWAAPVGLAAAATVLCTRLWLWGRHDLRAPEIVDVPCGQRATGGWWERTAGCRGLSRTVMRWQARRRDWLVWVCRDQLGTALGEETALHFPTESPLAALARQRPEGAGLQAAGLHPSTTNPAPPSCWPLRPLAQRAQTGSTAQAVKQRAGHPRS